MIVIGFYSVFSVAVGTAVSDRTGTSTAHWTDHSAGVTRTRAGQTAGSRDSPRCSGLDHACSASQGSCPEEGEEEGKVLTNLPPLGGKGKFSTLTWPAERALWWGCPGPVASTPDTCSSK